MLATQIKKSIPEERLPHFTTEQYFGMIDDGYIAEGAPYELLDGIVVLKDRGELGAASMSVGWMHNLLVTLFSFLNPDLEKFGCFIQTQGPVLLGSAQAPEPDAAIIRGSPLDYKRLPGSLDVICIFEVAASSLQQDRTTKQRIYARAGISQYVLVNLIDHQIELYKSPDADSGTYSACTILKSADSLVLDLDHGNQYRIAVEKLLPSELG